MKVMKVMKHEPAQPMKLIDGVIFGAGSAVVVFSAGSVVVVVAPAACVSLICRIR